MYRPVTEAEQRRNFLVLASGLALTVGMLAVPIAAEIIIESRETPEQKIARLEKSVTRNCTMPSPYHEMCAEEVDAARRELQTLKEKKQATPPTPTCICSR